MKCLTHFEITSICFRICLFPVLQSCSLSFNPTNSSAEGSYAVQLIMEDFPRQTIALIDSNGVQQIITTSDFISKTPVQFLFKGSVLYLVWIILHIQRAALKLNLLMYLKNPASVYKSEISQE